MSLLSMKKEFMRGVSVHPSLRARLTIHKNIFCSDILNNENLLSI